MDWQTPEDTVPSDFITEANARSVLGKPPVTGAWREGDPVGNRSFVSIGALALERGGHLPAVRIAFETWGSLNADASNAVLVLHALTGDSHVVGEAGPGHPTAGWWNGIVGQGKAIDTDKWFVVAPNMLGGCQGTTGPASHSPAGVEWGSAFPFLTIRDQVLAQARFSTSIGVERWAAIIGGSMGGMQALEWAIEHPNRVARIGLLAVPPMASADQIALNSVQLDAIRLDHEFNDGDYYESTDGPHRGLSLARRMALLNYRSHTELDDRFARSWQSSLSPIGGGGKYAVESYLDFHGNKFTRRFDANSYLTLVEAMNSHDIGRDRGGLVSALERISATTLIVGISSDRLFPVANQHFIAEHVTTTLDGTRAIEIDSPFGHDGFLIEDALIGQHIERLLAA
jgi:homoserine O-acetyltransferase